jgi:hypothetical protein
MYEVNEKAEFYRCGAEEARNVNQTDAWRDSHRANKACRDYIDSPETGLSAVAYKDYCVDADGAYSKLLVGKFGYQRTMCVLASTINHANWDGRYSPENKAWAEEQLGSMNPEQTRDYRLSSTHPGLTNILTNNVRQEYNALGLYTAEHCEVLLSSRNRPKMANKNPPLFEPNLLTIGKPEAVIGKVHDLTAMCETVEERGGEDSVAEEFRPTVEAFV